MRRLRLEFYSRCNGKPLKGFKQGSSIAELIWQQDPAGCSAGRDVQVCKEQRDE